ncbi:MAG: EAL domain-containing protein, partial [Gammaproteobacteria bacterium]
LEISATIGVALIDANTQSSASILSESELARDTAKDLGKNRVHVFQSEDGELLRRKDQMQWVTRIKSALREDRFVIYGQPIVPLQDSSVPHHIEILLRLQDEDGSILTPWTFLPAAERYHLMPEIDRWVVNQTLTMLSEQNNRHAGMQIKVAINLSGQSLGNEEFLDFLLHRLDQVDFSLENICFEVTESAAISNLAEAQHFMSVLKEKGCRFSLDDFGTGLSSFAYLKNLPVDYLKIDGSFVKEIVNDPISDAMVSAINQVGQVMGLKTIAEFVENDAIKDHLKKLGVNYAQGYGVGKPRPILEQLEDMLQ